MNIPATIIANGSGRGLCLRVNGYLMYQGIWEDVLARDGAKVPCRLVSNGLHAPASEPDVFREGGTEGLEVWMADTDRGSATAWAVDPCALAAYLTTLPPKVTEDSLCPEHPPMNTIYYHLIQRSPGNFISSFSGTPEQARRKVEERNSTDKHGCSVLLSSTKDFAEHMAEFDRLNS